MAYPDEWLASYEAWCAHVPVKEGESVSRHRKRWADTARQRARHPLSRPEDLAVAHMLLQADRQTAIVTVKAPPTEAELEARFLLLEQADQLKTTPTQESTTFTAPDGLPTGVVFFSDLHVGAGGVDYPRLRADLERCRDTEGLYAVINGDVVENTKPQSKSGTALYHALFADPNEQIAYVTLRLRLIADKLLAIAEGNHDAFDGRFAGIDRLPALARDLGCPSFSERGGTIVCHVGGERYHLVVKHQYAGSSRINTTNNHRRLWDEYPDFDNADVIALAHLHYPDLQQVPRKGQIVTYLRSGTYKTHDSWAEARGYQPMYGAPVTILYPDTHQVVALADFPAACRFLTAERARYRAVR